MMKIAHVADIHVGLGYPGPTPEARFRDVGRVMDWTADKIIAEGCRYVFFCGDAFKDSRVFIDRASREIKLFTDWLRKLSDAGIDVVCISGTPSHDSIAAYELIREMQIKNVDIRTEPGVLVGENFNLICLPGMDRSSIANRDEYKHMSAQEIHQLMTDKITSMVQGLSELAGCDRSTILMAHITTTGADKGYEDLLMQQEPVLTSGAIASSDLDLVCLGHIHNRQRVGSSGVPCFYAGSPERLSFSEQDIVPGFWIHELDSIGKYVESVPVDTPAREYVTLESDTVSMPENGFETWLRFVHGETNGKYLLDSSQEGCIVRYRYRTTEARAEHISHRKMIDTMYRAGAFYVTGVERDIVKKDRVRSKDARADMDPLAGLKVWCGVQQIDKKEQELIINKAVELVNGEVDQG